MMGTPSSHAAASSVLESLQDRRKDDIRERRRVERSAASSTPAWIGNIRRAIDIRENEKINQSALKNLIREAVALNLSLKSKPKKTSNKTIQIAYGRVALQP